MTEVELVSIESQRLNLSTVQRSTGAGEPWSLLAVLDNGHGRASTAVWDWARASPISSLDWRDWRGWEGERSYSSLEGELEITARHDGLGQISLLVSVGCLAPPTWRFETEMAVGAGAHAEALASDVAALLAGA